MKKRSMSLLLAIVMIVSCLPTGALAATGDAVPTIAVENVTAAAGTEVNVNLLVTNNPGMAGAKFSVSYDENLTLIGAVSGDAMSVLDYTKPGKFVSPCNFTWDSENAETTEDGVVLTLTFQVSEDAPTDAKLAVNLNYRYGDIYSSDLESLSFEMISGYVTVVNYIPGDVNGDGVVNGKDVTLVRRFNAGGYGTVINELAADVNADGVINGKDITLLRRYNAGGYEGVELLPGLVACSHVMQAYKAKAATCTEDGNYAYWYCSVCQRYFIDEAGATEIAFVNTILKAYGHNIVTVPGYGATKVETGLTDGKACNRFGCGYVEVKQEVIPVITGYKITYEIANGDDYIEKQSPIIPADKMEYFSDTGLELPQLKVAGYRFIGWSYSQASSDNIITKIPAGENGDKTLYAHWQIIEYTVTFDSPDIPVESVTYTVDRGATLKNPSCFGYTFIGWSNDDGFIVNRIKPGTTGHMTLHANWTSDRNKATSYQSYGEPIIIEDDVNGQILFIYNIGKIDNVPLNEVEFIGKTETLNYKKEVAVTDKVDETYVDNINKMISEATTKSSGWILAKEWEDIYATQNEVGSLSEKSDERTTAEGKTVGGKYFVSNSEGGSTHVSTESGSSSANSSKVTTENSVGINASYDKSTEKYCDAQLGVKTHLGGSNTTEVSAGVEVPVSIAKVSAGVKNTTTVEGSLDTEAGFQAGRKDNTAYHIDGSTSSYVGTINTNSSSSYYNSAVSNSSNWNSNTGYEQSSELHKEESVTAAIKEQIAQTTTHNMSKALGETNTETAEKQEQHMSAEEYSTSFSYNKGTQTTTIKTFEFNSSEPGYYRIITAGTVHVYGVVGYDVATASYYTHCYNVLDDTTREILDYSKDNMNFNDCENGVVTFEVPYEINEYIAGFVGKTDGLEISYEGVVTGFKSNEDFEGTVVIPQYEAKDNEDGSFSAVKVTSFDVSAFAGNTDIKTVVLPIYITEIPDGAFAGCTNLETVIAFGVTKIGANAFKDCTSLKKFYVDNAITSLGANAFQNVPEVAITAYDSKVADAAISCNAKRISVNIAHIKDTYENKVVQIGTDVEYFALIGNGGNYKNIQIESNAAETMISNMIFASNKDNPIKLASSKVTLARVTVENSPAFALVLTADQVKLDLLGTVSLNAVVENTVLSKNVILNSANQSTTSKLVVNGKYLVCGEMTNKNYLNVEPTVITEEQFNSYLVSSVVTFNANGGSVDQSSKIVYMGQQYGALPTPQKQYFAFKGWYTAAEGGTKITADTMVSTKVNHTLYAQWDAITATIQFNANGGQVSTTNKLVYIGEKVGTLPTPTRSHYSFKGWYTAATGGSQITADSILTVAETKTIYAQWNIVPYTVKWNTGTGYTITVKRTSSPYAGAATETLTSGAKIYYGDVLSVSYTKHDYYTIKSNGATSIAVTGNVTSSQIYATAELNPIKGWVKASELPSGAQVTSRKWTYNLTTTTESRETSLAGYTQIGSYWVKSGSGSANYASFPSGFDTGNSIYTSFMKAPYTSSETATTKRTVSNTRAGYIYWHWMYSTGTSTGYLNRAIYYKKGYAPASSVGSQCASYKYQYFQAFTSNKAYSAEYSNWDQGHGQYLWYNCTGVNARSSYFYRLDYYTSTYTDYYKMFQYQKVENLESNTKVTASGSISNVQEWVQYRVK